ncbi:MAG TPA: hypothetical protein ENI27_02330 [bacterium]|nr:hypothetical protein [bacterium]
MFAIIWRTVKDRKISLIVYLATTVLFMWMYVAMFPSMLEQSAAFVVAFESFPEGLFKAIGIEELNMSTIEHFLSMEHFSLVWPLMAIFLIVAIAGSGLAGQVEQGTAELLLALPVSRFRIFMAKYLVGIFSLLVFTIFSVFAIVPLAPIHKVEYAIGNFASVALISFLFGWAVFSVATMFSAVFSEKSRVYMATGGVLLVMYVLNIAAALQEKLQDLRYVSFFHYYDYNDALIRNTLDTTNVLVFVVVAIVCTAAGALWFRRRDIAV